MEDELANMEQEALDDKMLKTGTVPVVDRLPAVGNGEIRGKERRREEVQEEEDEEAELKKLQAEMAM